MARLDTTILNALVTKSGKQPSTIRSAISRKRQKYPNITLNAAAHLVAQDYHTTVLQKLSQEDRDSLGSVSRESELQTGQPATKKGPPNTRHRDRKKPLVDYPTNNHFVKEHIEELTRAYSGRCYTCVFILFRKIIENLIIDLLKNKYPAEPQLYLDTNRIRNLDFSVVLQNLYSRRSDFSPDGNKAIERLHQIVKPFKKDANDKTHSWFHVVRSQTEIDRPKLVDSIELIKVLEIEIGSRTPN